MNKQLQCRAQVLTVHRGGVLCILLVVKRAAQTDTGSRLYSNVSFGLGCIPRNL